MTSRHTLTTVPLEIPAVITPMAQRRAYGSGAMKAFYIADAKLKRSEVPLKSTIIALAEKEALQQRIIDEGADLLSKLVDDEGHEAAETYVGNLAATIERLHNKRIAEEATYDECFYEFVVACRELARQLVGPKEWDKTMTAVYEEQGVNVGDQAVWEVLEHYGLLASPSTESEVEGSDDDPLSDADSAQ